MTNTTPNSRRLLAASIGLLLGTVGFRVLAQNIPNILPYQGVVDVNGVPFTGIGQFKFALISPNGATTYWSNDSTSVAGSQPVDAVTRPVEGGVFSVNLGDPALANMTPVPASVFAGHAGLHMRVWFNNGVIGFQQLQPDTAIGSAGYAMMSQQTAGLAAGTQISGANIPSGTLGISHLATPGAPLAGQVLAYDGNGFAWTDPSPGGGGDSVFSLNGVNAYYNAGRVGIGTTSPAGALQVASGGLAVTGESSPYTGTGKGVFIESNPTFGGHVFAYDYAAGAGRALLLNYPGGNVGIGTPTPSTRVEIAETWDENWSANLTLSGNRPTLMWHHPGSGPGEAGTQHYWINHMNAGDLIFYKRRTKEAVPFEDSGWGERVRFTASGRVGIGTPIPSAQLEIVGQHALQLVGFQPYLTLADSNFGYARARMQNVNGELVLQPESFINGSNPNNFARLENSGTFSVKTLTIRGGADLSEPFAMSESQVQPGAVVVIDERNPGKLRRSSTAYDKKVAGIVSGANGIQPGISMIQEDALEAGENVALSGRVYVNANTTGGRIEPGDLLTTSEIPGEAMKAGDHQRAQGAILGKAMTALNDHSGTVLVLVTLQ